MAVLTGSSGTAASTARLLAHRLWRHWATRVVLVYLASRVVSTVILLVFAALQAENPWTAAHPPYDDFAMMWDAHWYWIVAVSGYPSELPMTEDGFVGESAWAFLPVYPMLANWIAAVADVPYAWGAIALAGSAGLGTALLAERMFRAAGLDGRQALAATALLCFAPLSPVLQLAYAESLQLLLITGALLLVLRHRYWLTIPVVALLAFTRPGALAFALMLGLHVILRWWRDRRGLEAFELRDRVAAVTATIVAGLLGFAWLGVAALRTGSPTAYLDTELAWRAPYIGRTELLPFTSWPAGAVWWSEWNDLPGWVGIVVLVILVAAAAWWLLSPASKAIGSVLRLWVASWLLYLLAVFFPQTSTWRLLLPAYPALGAIAAGPRWLLWPVLALSVAGQVWWVGALWSVQDADWSPP